MLVKRYRTQRKPAAYQDDPEKKLNLAGNREMVGRPRLEHGTNGLKVRRTFILWICKLMNCNHLSVGPSVWRSGPNWYRTFSEIRMQKLMNLILKFDSAHRVVHFRNRTICQLTLLSPRGERGCRRRLGIPERGTAEGGALRGWKGPPCPPLKLAAQLRRADPYADFFIASRIKMEALFAASCNDFVERCAYQCVTDGLLRPCSDSVLVAGRFLTPYPFSVLLRLA